MRGTAWAFPDSAKFPVQRRLRRTQDRVSGDRKSLGDEQFLGEFLIHACGTSQHTGTHVRHAGEFQQTLDGAVLAVGAVQHREDHIDGAQDFACTRG